MNPSSERKLFQKHTPQKLTIRANLNDLIGRYTSKVVLSLNVAAKLLENLPDMCYVAVEQFALVEKFSSPFDLNYVNSVFNIESPLFSNPYQYIPKWSVGGGEYSSIITSIPINSSTFASDLRVQTNTSYVDYVGGPTSLTPTGTGSFVTTNATGITATIINYVMNVTNITVGKIIVGQSITAGTNVIFPTYILSQMNGTPGGTGDYLVSVNYGNDGVNLGAAASTGGTVTTNLFTYAPAVPGGNIANPGAPVTQVSLNTNACRQYKIAWAQNILQNNIGCYVVNKQMLNNQTIPFNITNIDGSPATSAVIITNIASIDLQMTLVFYGLNDDERYSIIPSV
jgi:hypothetical protein